MTRTLYNLNDPKSSVVSLSPFASLSTRAGEEPGGWESREPELFALLSAAREREEQWDSFNDELVKKPVRGRRCSCRSASASCRQASPRASSRPQVCSKFPQRPPDSCEISPGTQVRIKCPQDPKCATGFSKTQNAQQVSARPQGSLDFPEDLKCMQIFPKNLTSFLKTPTEL